MNQSHTKSERTHIELVKMLQCSVCDAHGPSAAHHIRQNQPYLCVALCHSCHQDPRQGIHGQKFAWKLRKMDEYDALAVTIRRLLE